ncbi:MAG: glycerol-3-phosphate 1-O-acyltransferase PlsY, partial [Chloroflexi bacterium]|nr:glycerol-3-phosphate 1-O-acyltransferase PlsY [Chloroflexota bacterium]
MTGTPIPGVPVSGAGLVVVLLLALIGVASYLIGSISSGFLVGKIYRNVDLRRVGSGSTGATNTFRTLGPGAGALVAVFDITKGALAVWLARAVVPVGGELLVVAQAIAAMGAVAGHCWPALLEGRGGRGVATAFGAFVFIATGAWIGAVLAFVLALAVTRIVSVGSLASVAGGVLAYVLLSAFGIIGFHPATLAFTLVAGAIIVWRHRPNIERLMRGAEPR